MKVSNTNIEGLIKIKNKIIFDDRGYFIELLKKNQLEKIIKTQLVQENISFSKNKYTLRGMHAQLGKSKQAKLVRCLKGKILDIAVDIRKQSPTFLKHYKIELSENNALQLFIPAGFLHGFLTLEKNTLVNYFCSSYYSKNDEINVNFSDPKINIDWGIDRKKITISKKDKNAPYFYNLV